MQPEVFAARMNAKSQNLMSSGGSFQDILTSGDINAVMAACEAPELIKAYLLSYYDCGVSYERFVPVGHAVKVLTKPTVHDVIMGRHRPFCQIKFEQVYRREKVSSNFEAFAQMLIPWIRANYYAFIKEDNPAKRNMKAAKAAADIHRGLARYLSENPEEENRIAKYFRPLPRQTFDRKYKTFAVRASRNFSYHLGKLRKQIVFYTQNEHEY